MLKILCLFSLSLFISWGAFALPADPHYPQGAIWALREAGYKKEAQALENKVIQILLTEEIRAVADLGAVTSNGSIVRFSNNIFAVMKEDDPKVKGSHRIEAGAFVADRVMDLNMFPVTVVREFEGKRYSLQLYYPHFTGDLSQISQTEYGQSRYWDLVVVDKVMGNVDRVMSTRHNLEIGIEGRQVAIDNARMHQNKNVFIDPSELAKTSPGLKEKIAKLSYETLSPSGLFEPHEVEGMMKISQKMLVVWPDVIEQPTRPVVRAEKIFLPSEFLVPQELANREFKNTFALKRVLGPRSASYQQDDIRQQLQDGHDPKIILEMAVKNWKFYSSETRKLVLPMIYSLEDFAKESAFIQQLVVENPKSVPHFLAQKPLREWAFYEITSGLMRGRPESFTAELRRLVIYYLVAGQKNMMLGFNFDDLFKGPETELKRALLRETYEAVVRAGMQDHLVAIFRLREPQNEGLGLRIFEALPLAQRPLLKERLLKSYETLMAQKYFDREGKTGKIVQSRILEIQGWTLMPPTCQGLF